MATTIDVLRGEALADRLEDLARLRIEVFREWPYLYDGDLAYERRYLDAYRRSDDAIVVGAFDDDALVGAATGTPMRDHADAFAAAFAGLDVDLDRMFYCAESVLRAPYRGREIGHRFFDEREAHARDVGADHVTFCAVVRPADHPLRPPGARSLETFWRKRGYRPLEGVVAHFRWKDVDRDEETDHALQFWMKTL